MTSRRSRSTNAAIRSRKTQLGVESLEERSLMDTGAAGFVAGSMAEDRDWTVHATVVPNDSQFNALFGLNNTGQSGGKADADIDAPEAWNITTGSLKNIVAVIDTGIDYRHQDLYKNIWVNQKEIPTAIKALLVDVDSDGLFTLWDLNDSRNAGRVTDGNANGYIDGGDLLRTTAQGGFADGVSNDGDSYVDDLIGWNFINNTNNPLDDNSHGTHVAGTIGAMGNNGVGVVGVNWKVQMMALKFLGADGSGSISAAARALNYAVANGSQVSNNSWGGGGYSSSLYSALVNARANGHVFVAAAGNAGANNDATIDYPSGYNLDNIISVAASTRTDSLASYSNYGAASVDLAAPGSSIVSTTPNNGYGTKSGTSMATPHVAGALALVRAANPDLTYSQLISRILNNVDVVSSLSGKVATGGRLNVYNALVNGSPGTPAPTPAPAPTPTPTPTPPPADTSGARVLSVTPNGTTSVSSLRVTFSEAIDAATFTASDITGFTGPNGSSIGVSSIAAVAGSNGTQFDVRFATQTGAGTYRLNIGPDVRDLAGNRMNQDGDSTNGESTADRYAASFSVAGTATYQFSAAPNAAMFDVGTLVSTITINQDISVADLNVKIKISHTRVGDLLVKLRGPDGTEVTLVNHRGGTGDNFSNTTFSDEASKTIVNASAPYSGSYRAEGSLAAFDGKSAKGTWQLIVVDSVAGRSGTFNSWSLTIKGTAASSTAGAHSVDDGDVPEATSETFRFGAAPQDDGAAQGASLSLSQGGETGRSRAQDVRQAAQQTVRHALDGVYQSVGSSQLRSRFSAPAASLQPAATASLDPLLSIFESGLN